MSQQDGREAIRVVIEKLTEIVKESKEDVKTNYVQDIVPDGKLNVGTFTIMDNDDCESQIEIVETEEHPNEQILTTQDELDASGNHDASSTVEITVNVPADLKKSLDTSDPRALLAALMSMDSNQMVVTQGSQQPVVEFPSVNMVENVAAEFVVMAAEPESSVEIQENIVEVTTTTTPEKVESTEVVHESEQDEISIVKSSAKTVDKGGQTAEKKVTLKCSKCDYCSHNKHYLKQHVDLVHNADRPFKCPFCDYAGKRSHSLKEHLVVHSTNRPFICPVCNASFRKKGHLTNHVKLHNTLKYFECSHCVEKFTTKSQLYSHIRTAHDPNDVHECNVCEYATMIKSNIVMHMHTHGNPKVYRCNVCSFTANHINILRQHMQSHSVGQANLYNVETNNSAARPVILLKCSSCGYTTDNRDTLRTHMWKHMSEEPASDVSDQKDPGVKNNPPSEPPAESSVAGQERISLYKCSECSYCCKQAYMFITHMLAHHPRQKLIADHQKQQRQAPDANNQQENKKESVPAFTHDSTAGMYRCTICGYMCEQQRTIKAHIWKHSGHKDIDYPMFQNGPISVYDDTPLGKSVLVTAEKSKPPIKIVPITDHEEQTDAVLEGKESEGKSRNQQLSTNILPNTPRAARGVTPQVALAMDEDTKEKVKPVVASVSEQHSQATSGKNQAPLFSHPPVQWMMNRGGAGALRPIVPLTVKHSQPVKICQPQPPSQQSQSSAFPALVQLIMSPKQMHGSQPSTQSDASNASPCKRKLSAEAGEQDDSIEGVAKRMCLEENQTEPVPKSNGNVVVQHVSQVYSTPTITIACNPVTSAHLETGDYRCTNTTIQSQGSSSTAIDHTVNLHAPETGTTSEGTDRKPSSLTKENNADVLEVDEEMQVETSDDVQNPDEHSPSKADSRSGEILRSLLKKCPNHNPDCVKGAQPEEKGEEDTGISVSTKAGNTNSDNETENPQASEDNRKKGICSSLLAVIEQLREKSKSEITERGKDSESGASKESSGITKTAVKRRGRRSSLEDEMPIEQYPNVEKIEKNQHRCKLCHYTSTSPNLIKTHMRLHKTFEPFECSLCDFHATSSEGLQDHMLQHCKVRVYHCKVCTAEFNYKSQLRAHMRAHYEADPFVCDMCDYETTNPISFRNHTWGHKKKKVEGAQSDTGDSSSDSCASQNVRTDNNQDLWCDQCIYVGKTSEDLIEHLQVEHRKVYRCELCNQQFYSSIFLKDHMKFHDREKQKVRVELKKCELCDFTAISTRSLKSHMKRHINDQRFVQQPLEQYKCNLCGYVCHHLPSLKSHMWRHASNQNYSYQEINDLINAAIDYDSSSRVLETDDDPGQAGKLDKETRVKRNSDNIESQSPLDLGGENSPELENIADPVSISKSLVTFRCCQCGFESAEKSLLNIHMKTHLDIIRKTLAVNKSQFVARAVKEMAEDVQKEYENLRENPEITSQKMAANISEQEGNRTENS